MRNSGNGNDSRCWLRARGLVYSGLQTHAYINTHHSVSSLKTSVSNSSRLERLTFVSFDLNQDDLNAVLLRAPRLKELRLRDCPLVFTRSSPHEPTISLSRRRRRRRFTPHRRCRRTFTRSAPDSSRHDSDFEAAIDVSGDVSSLLTVTSLSSRDNASSPHVNIPPSPCEYDTQSAHPLMHTQPITAVCTRSTVDELEPLSSPESRSSTSSPCCTRHCDSSRSLHTATSTTNSSSSSISTRSRIHAHSTTSLSRRRRSAIRRDTWHAVSATPHDRCHLTSTCLIRATRTQVSATRHQDVTHAEMHRVHTHPRTPLDNVMQTRLHTRLPPLSPRYRRSVRSPQSHARVSQHQQHSVSHSCAMDCSPPTPPSRDSISGRYFTFTSPRASQPRRELLHRASPPPSSAAAERKSKSKSKKRGFMPSSVELLLSGVDRKLSEAHATHAET